jgi:hypothetical protein
LASWTVSASNEDSPTAVSPKDVLVQQHLEPVAERSLHETVRLVGVRGEEGALLAVAVAPLVREDRLDDARPGRFGRELLELFDAAHLGGPRNAHARRSSYAVGLLLIHEGEVGAPWMLEEAQIVRYALRFSDEPRAPAVGRRQDDALAGGRRQPVQRLEPETPLRFVGSSHATHPAAVCDDRRTLHDRHACAGADHSPRERHPCIERVEHDHVWPGGHALLLGGGAMLLGGALLLGGGVMLLGGSVLLGVGGV